jgi:hypothetical protein
VAEDKCNDDGVVELTRDRDEVGNEIERQGQVADEREQEQLATTRNAHVAGEPRDEDDAVRDEGGERAGVATATHENESDHECCVHESQHCGPDQEPAPPRHGRNLCHGETPASSGSIDVDYAAYVTRDPTETNSRVSRGVLEAGATGLEPAIDTASRFARQRDGRLVDRRPDLLKKVTRLCGMPIEAHRLKPRCRCVDQRGVAADDAESAEGERGRIALRVEESLRLFFGLLVVTEGNERIQPRDRRIDVPRPRLVGGGDLQKASSGSV